MRKFFNSSFGSNFGLQQNVDLIKLLNDFKDNNVNKHKYHYRLMFLASPEMSREEIIKRGRILSLTPLENISQTTLDNWTTKNPQSFFKYYNSTLDHVNKLKITILELLPDLIFDDNTLQKIEQLANDIRAYRDQHQKNIDNWVKLPVGPDTLITMNMADWGSPNFIALSNAVRNYYPLKPVIVASNETLEFISQILKTLHQRQDEIYQMQEVIKEQADAEEKILIEEINASVVDEITSEIERRALLDQVQEYDLEKIYHAPISLFIDEETKVIKPMIDANGEYVSMEDRASLQDVMTVKPLIDENGEVIIEEEKKASKAPLIVGGLALLYLLGKK